ncbi:MAG: tetratricopeptide repeat protein, partial [Candidatus Omnitrophota bacterium]
SGSVKGKFLYDDYLLVKDNQFIKSPAYLKDIFTSDTARGARRSLGSYRPFQLLTYMSDHVMWGAREEGYHITNIFLHISAAFALYWMLTVLFGDHALSFFTCLLWAVNPLHTEAVMYISGRADPLAALFIFSGMAFYVKSARSGPKIFYIASLVCYSSALLSRESSLVFPLLIALYHFSFKEKIPVYRFAGIAGLSALYAAARFTLLGHILETIHENTRLIERIPSFLAAAANYMKLVIMPFGLHMEYGKRLFSFTDPLVIGGGLLLAAMAFFLIAERKNKIIFFSIAWALLTLLPHSNIFPVNAYMAEHWLYLPLAGISLAVSYGALVLYRKDGFRVTAVIAMAFITAYYSLITFRQSEYWKDPVSFYTGTLKYPPGNSRIYNNLANTYEGEGRVEEAVALWKKAIQIRPDYSEAYNNLAVTYAGMKRYKEAAEMFEKAIKLDPGIPELYNNAGNVYLNLGRGEEARASYEKAIALNPYYADAYFNMSRMCYNEGRYGQAVRDCDMAVRYGYKVEPGYLEEIKKYRKK